MSPKLEMIYLYMLEMIYLHWGTCFRECLQIYSLTGMTTLTQLYQQNPPASSKLGCEPFHWCITDKQQSGHVYTAFSHKFGLYKYL